MVKTKTKQNKTPGSGKMTLPIKSLLHDHEDPNSSPQYPGGSLAACLVPQYWVQELREREEMNVSLGLTRQPV